MSPALLNIALGVANKVVAQIDEPSEKQFGLFFMIEQLILAYLVLVKYTMQRLTHCETKMMKEAMWA